MGVFDWPQIFVDREPQEAQPRALLTPEIIVLEDGNEFFRAGSLQQITPNVLNHWRNQWMQLYKSCI